MTSDQKDLVCSSFAAVAPNADAVAATFYARLFELNLALRPLFKGDMAAQGRKLMAMIATAVANLHNLDTVTPAVEQLGRRHVGYGVTDQDYDTVGSALLWTLEQELGSAFTPATPRRLDRMLPHPGRCHAASSTNHREPLIPTAKTWSKPMAIDFELTDAQKKLQATAREFAIDCLAPVVSAADQEPDAQKAFQMMREPYREAYKLGFAMGFLPKDYGGGGVSMSTCNSLLKK